MSLFGEGSIWELGGIGSFIEKSGVQLVLEKESFTLEDLLQQTEIIQETQSQGPKLLEYLLQHDTLTKLLDYIVVPQDEHDEDKAYKFPYMACEMLSCAVPSLLDRIVDRQADYQHLRQLFSAVQPSLRKDGSAAGQGSSSGSPMRPYLAGYFCKVAALLCKKRSAAMVRFLDLTPGIAEGLLQQLDNGNVSSLVITLLSLPFQCGRGSTQGLVARQLRLARGDKESMLLMLLGKMQEALQLTEQLVLEGAGAGKGDASSAARAAGAAQQAAEVLCSLMLTARSSTPHGKYAAEGYNAHVLGRKAQQQHSDGQDGEEGDEAKLSKEANPYAFNNCQMDASFYATASGSKKAGGSAASASTLPDSVSLRFFKALRDAGPAHKLLLELSVQACGLLGSAAGSKASSTAADNSYSSLAQAAAEPVFRVLGGVLEAVGVSYYHYFVCGMKGEEGEEMQPPACPAIAAAAAQLVLPAAAAFLKPLVEDAKSRSGAAAAGSAAAAASAPSAAASPTPSSPSAPRLGTAGLALVRSLCHLLTCDWAAVNASLSEQKLLQLLLDTMAGFAWHSVLHRAVTDALLNVLRWGSCTLRRSLLVDADLPATIAAGLQLAGLPSNLAEAAAGEGAGKQPSRVGYAGHFIALANVLAAIAGTEAGSSQPECPLDGSLDARREWQGQGSAADADSALVQQLQSSQPSFWASVDGPAAIYSIKHGLLLGGVMAPDTKKSGNIGASADATGGAAGGGKVAVDEVAMLEKKEEEEGGDAGSDSSSQGSREEGVEEQEDQDDKGGSLGGARARAASGGSEEEAEETAAGGKFQQPEQRARAASGGGSSDSEEGEEEVQWQRQQAEEHEQQEGAGAAQHSDSDEAFDFSSFGDSSAMSGGAGGGENGQRGASTTAAEQSEQQSLDDFSFPSADTSTKAASGQHEGEGAGTAGGSRGDDFESFSFPAEEEEAGSATAATTTSPTKVSQHEVQGLLAGVEEQGEDGEQQGEAIDDSSLFSSATAAAGFEDFSAAFSAAPAARTTVTDEAAAAALSKAVGGVSLEEEDAAEKEEARDNAVSPADFGSFDDDGAAGAASAVGTAMPAEHVQLQEQQTKVSGGFDDTFADFAGESNATASSAAAASSGDGVAFPDDDFSFQVADAATTSADAAASAPSSVAAATAGTGAPDGFDSFSFDAFGSAPSEDQAVAAVTGASAAEGEKEAEFAVSADDFSFDLK